MRKAAGRKISIHALREEGDRSLGWPAWRSPISIHALREEGDQGARETHLHQDQFLSTPSARRATEDGGGVGSHSLISIHALREEGDFFC